MTWFLGTFFNIPRWIWIGGLALAAVAGTIVGIKVHDHSVIAQHEAAQAAADAKASLEAERRANAVATAAETARQERAAQAAKDMTDAEVADPIAAKASAGRVSRAAVNRLRTRAGQQHTAP